MIAPQIGGKNPELRFLTLLCNFQDPAGLGLAPNTYIVSRFSVEARLVINKAA